MFDGGKLVLFKKSLYSRRFTFAFKSDLVKVQQVLMHRKVGKDFLLLLLLVLLGFFAQEAIQELGVLCFFWVGCFKSISRLDDFTISDFGNTILLLGVLNKIRFGKDQTLAWISVARLYKYWELYNGYPDLFAPGQIWSILKFICFDQFWRILTTIETS
ncbi:hypothetical protein L6452_01094 [Arctium lappa]|uniref:Uncharacterized protein n=1 Tax=Arctium lappa TaxID=4217 RepID=A0ACB9FH02_ARCLA|nr:hypothetical protein L6452_01094 [Arctium lappa]